MHADAQLPVNAITRSEQLLLDIRQLLATQASYQKPILTVDEAADLLGISAKRLSNIISEEKRQRGRLPSFVCDAGGKLHHRVLREELLKWAASPAKRVGRSRKRN